MICGKCTANIPGQDIYEHAGWTLCEDCYIDAVSAPKTCDPWAVYAATRTTTKGENLTPELKRILDLIKTNGPISLERICSELSLSEQEFRTHFSTLRHMELAQACKQDDQVLYIPFRKP
jgi:predicted transcriptional regulator